MAGEDDEVGRIVIRLVQSEDGERAIYEAYLAKPRSRRQEWLRSVLAAGFAAIQGEQKPLTVAPPPGRVSPPAVALQPAIAAAPVVAAAPATHASEAAHIAQATADVPESTSILKGFFTNSARSNGG